MRKIQISTNEYYHIVNRGVNKEDIFLEKNDWVRFIFLILFFQSPISFTDVGKLSREFLNEKGIKEGIATSKIVNQRFVELTAFCLMSNHFHILVKETEENGISKYMQRVLNSYTKYFNTKYNKSGHLFEGPFRAVHVSDNNQLLYVSAYIHKNPTELSEWKSKEEKYVWSSYADFIKSNRWGDLLVPNIILDQFNNPEEYHEFVKSSTAKMLEEEIDSELI